MLPDNYMGDFAFSDSQMKIYTESVQNISDGFGVKTATRDEIDRAKRCADSK